ncbi:MAG: hypothetical protein ABIK45_06000 [Pseudomonadota bacterium]
MQHHADATSARRETISGFIVPMQWDDQFRVTEVLIACEAERDVQVANLHTFPALLSLTRTRASVTGTVRRVGNVETIHVESFTLVEATESR